MFATRGLEYGLAARELDLRAGVRELSLTLSREVDTNGFVAADTHIHTLTHSGHGDCTLLERMATIAGEGIELAVATDHNHHTDYAPTSHTAGTAPFFTPVIGNEVTTPVGHFNAFPIRRGVRTAPIDRADWRELVAGIRATPGVRAVVLNHPSNNHSTFIPTDPRRFHPASGESLDGRTFPLDLRLDGMEVVTSAAMQSDWMKPFRDWFALLNRGSRVTGIGSSDTHDVDRYILGQGRTYLALDDRHPEALSIEDACRSLTDGRASISMGLFCEAWIDGKGMGETVSGKPAEPSIRVRVQSPSWIRADRVEVFANGEWVTGQALARRGRGPGRWDVTLPLPPSIQDQWIVAIASGPGVREPYWPSPRPYQPTRPDWEPRVIGANNPIRVDRDGDGVWRSPRDEALRLVEGAAGDTQRLFAKLGERDSATAVQAAAILRGRGIPTAGPLVERSAPHVRQAFAAYTALLPR